MSERALNFLLEVLAEAAFLILMALMLRLVALPLIGYPATIWQCCGAAVGFRIVARLLAVKRA